MSQEWDTPVGDVAWLDVEGVRSAWFGVDASGAVDVDWIGGGC